MWNFDGMFHHTVPTHDPALPLPDQLRAHAAYARDRATDELSYLLTGEPMMTALNLLPMLVQLAQVAVLTVQGVHGDKLAGKDKMTMATDAFNTAVSGVLPTLPGVAQNIGKLVAVLGGVALQSAYLITKANGTYDAATQAATGAGSTQETVQAG